MSKRKGFLHLILDFTHDFPHEFSVIAPLARGGVIRYNIHSISKPE